jgi:preprotein translocase subunit SecD
MNQYPLWKNLFILIAVLFCAVYALPNLYGEDPAVQVSALRDAKLDEPARSRVEKAITGAGLAIKQSEFHDNQLLLRFNDTDAQLQAMDRVQATLGDAYAVALNLAPSTPGWLRALNALPMYLGLDLRGGVYFLLKVDMVAAQRQAQERYAGDLRALLREKKLRYGSVGREGAGVRVTFKDAQARDQARAAIHEAYRDLLLSEGDANGEFTLTASLGELELREIRDFALQQNILTLRNRVNELGVAEPIIQQQGQDRIVVQLPGVQDTARAKKILGATATLEYRLVDAEHSIAEAQAGRVPVGSKLYKQRNGDPILLKKGIIVTGDQITGASSGLDGQSGQPAVTVTLDSKGARKMGDTTQENVGKPMAVVFIENKAETRLVDGKTVRSTRVVEEVINVATIREPFSKRFQTTGLDSTNEARDLALLLRAGAMAVPSEIIEERTVGPSLGADNIKTGFNSTLIGFAAIAAFMVFYYHLFGLIATLALAVNLVMLMAVLSLLQATLTLPGIAGIALTVGMAIDANVLIFERIREELRNGNSPQASIHAGYDRALATIVDSNITTLIAGVALFMLGSGPIRGFAVVLCLGILTSLFSAIWVSRAIVNIGFGGRKLARLSI